MLDKNKFKLVIKDGESVYFWEDLWSSKSILCEKFKSLYELSNVKGVVVRGFLDLIDCYEPYGTSLWRRTLR